MSAYLLDDRYKEMQSLSEIRNAIVNGLVEDAIASIRHEVEQRACQIVHDMEPTLTRWWDDHRAKEVIEFSVRVRT